MASLPDPPHGWGSDPVTEFLDTARENSYATFAELPRDFACAVQVENLYRILVTHLDHSPDWVPALFLLRSHAAFLGAVHFAMSGQAAESFMVSRGCLENALYGFYIYRHPDTAKAWLERDTDAESLGRVRDQFRIGSMKRDLRAIDEKLANLADHLYERTIAWGAHPNEKALTSSTRIVKEGANTKFEVRYLTAEPEAIRLSLKTSAQIGVCCVRVFGLVFSHRFKILDLPSRVRQLEEDYEL